MRDLHTKFITWGKSIHHVTEEPGCVFCTLNVFFLFFFIIPITQAKTTSWITSFGHAGDAIEDLETFVSKASASTVFRFWGKDGT